MSVGNGSTRQAEDGSWTALVAGYGGTNALSARMAEQLSPVFACIDVISSVDAMRQAVGEHVATKVNLDAFRAELKADVYRALWMQAAGIIGLTVALVKIL